MTREQAMAKVNAYNAELKDYTENGLYEELGVDKNKKVNGGEWFKLWNKAYNLLYKYYEIGSAVQSECRACGHDVKMNMQSYELILH